MNDIYFGKKVEIIPSKLSIADIKNVHFAYEPGKVIVKSVMAECDKESLKDLRKLLKNLNMKIALSSGVFRDSYITIYREVLKKISRYEIVKLENPFDNFQISEGFVYDRDIEKQRAQKKEHSNIESEKEEKKSSLYERLQTINNEGRIFTDEERLQDKSLNLRNSVSLGKVSEGFAYDHDIEKQKVQKNEHEKIESENEEKKSSLYERLQAINNEGRIFTDEERLQDKSLNLQNSVSLGKISDVEIKTNPARTCYVNFKNSMVARIGKKSLEKIKKFVTDTKYAGKIEPCVETGGKTR